MTDARLAAPFLGQLTTAARGLGLTIEEPRVLGVGANVVVHLAPSPVVARIATLTAVMRRGADGWWRHEFREAYALLWNLLYAQRYERARGPAAVRLAGWLEARR